jgi:hypothetical protein
MNKYFITEYRVDNLDMFVRELFKKLNLNPSKINSHMTKKEYDSSDFVAWVLLYDNNKELKLDMEKVNSVYFGTEEVSHKVFNVSGNGYGNGISLIFNLNLKLYDQ